MKFSLYLFLAAALALSSCSTLANRRELYSPLQKTVTPGAQQPADVPLPPPV